MAQSFPAPKLILLNQLLSTSLGINLPFSSEKKIANILCGQENFNGLAPISLAYAGHQFGHFVPQLGDGRAMLLGEIISPSGKRYDLQLKGSGPTTYSRNGDGKSALGPVIREYILSEAMHALGVPTTRALAALETGETVYRNQPLPGGVFARVASSHIRIGTFEYVAAQNNVNVLKILADYSIERHYPNTLTKEHKYLSFLESVAHAQAKLIAKWMSFGFIHGVMNTDNMSISGETIDYGPCAFMDNYKSNRVFSSIDQQGRYAYNNQITIGKWNLYRLASALLPLIHKDQKQAVQMVELSISSYMDIYEKEWKKQMVQKLGLFEVKREDEALINSWLEILEKNDLDFTLSFRKLVDDHNGIKNDSRFTEFYRLWKNRLSAQDETLAQANKLMSKVNPIYIARNHQVEKAIEAALVADYSKFKEIIEVLKNPFERQDKYHLYAAEPDPSNRIVATFCGT